MQRMLNKGAIALRRWRRERNFTQSQCSRALNLSADSLVSRLERGSRPGIAIALHVSRQLGIEPELWMQEASAEEIAAHGPSNVRAHACADGEDEQPLVDADIDDEEDEVQAALA